MTNLRDIRLHRSLSLRQLGEKCGVPWQTIAAWETGRTTPPLNRLRTLLDACEVTDAERLSILSHDEAPTTAAPKTPKARPLVPKTRPLVQLPRKISRTALATNEERLRAQTTPRGEG